MKKATYIFIFILLFHTAGCSALIFFPKKELIDNPFMKLVSYEDINFETSDGITLHGWYVKGKNNSHGTIFFLHGNAENISTHINNVLWLAAEGYDIFAIDYRGYGRSAGHPTLEGVHRDAEAALNSLFNLPGVNTKRVFVFGQSLGGAIAVYTVANSPHKDSVKAIIIDSTFSSYRKIAREKLNGFFLTWPLQYPLSLPFDDYYSPVNWIKKVSPVPVFIIQGMSDKIVPPHHAEVLFKETMEPKELRLIPARGHIQSLLEEEERKHLLKYLHSFNK